jgi:hypothetical protein
MLYMGNGAESSRCSSTDNGAGTADCTCGSRNCTYSGSGSACDNRDSADGHDAADFYDRSADADHDEGRWTGREYYTGSSGSGDESGNDANG